MSDEQQGVTTQQLEQAALGLLRALAPVERTDEEVVRAFAVAHQQEEQLPAVYERLLDDEQFAAQLPRWGLKIVASSEATVFHAPRRLSRDAAPAEVMIYLASLGLLMNPVVRALMILHGISFEWKFMTKPSKPLIVLPGGKNGQ